MFPFQSLSAPGGPSDIVLVARLRRGDGGAFEAIMRRYNQRLYRVARSIVANDAEAEDVVQTAYLTAYAKLADFKGPGGFSAWLVRIATNEALGRLRRRGKVISLEEYLNRGRDPEAPEVMELPDLERPDPERLAASGEVRRLIEQLIDEMPDSFRTVFVLRAVEQMSVAETAASLGIRPETVKTRYHRARGHLRAALERQVVESADTAFPIAGARCDRIVAAVLRRLGLSPDLGPRPGPHPA